jgi:hypothetical protein
MCLAIAKPARAIVPVDHLHAGYQGNPHGCGFAYAEKGKLTIVRGLFTFKDFMEKYRKVEHLPMLIHFRYSTHGQPSVQNCHPFAMWDGRYALIHNGMIHIHQSISKELSDTAHFAKLIMEPMLKAGINPEKAAFRYLVEESIGSGNKVLIMDNMGKTTIYNESVGEYEDAEDKDGNPVIVEGAEGPEQATVWYSNAGYKFTRRRGKQRTEGDSYEGFFDCCQGEEVVPADFTTNLDTGFKGKAKLDAPPTPGVIRGFSSGVRTTADPGPVSAPIKDAGQSAEAIAASWGGKVVRTEKNGTKTEIPAPAEDEDGLITGPLFNYKIELEIAHLKETMNMKRDEAIKALGLEINDAVSYVEA